jgi:hypothetical protein
MAGAISASAQSVTISIVANDGNGAATNVMQVPAVRVQGLLAMWAEDSKSKTNAGSSALTFGQFIVQEIRDKGTDYANKGAIGDMLNWGITNPPAKLVSVWPSLTAAQKTNAVQYINQVGQ